MKTASQSQQKYIERASAASQDYVEGAQSTTKDQSQAAIAAIPNMKAGLDAAFARGAVAKGLQESGKSGWLKGVVEKGANRFAGGVAAGGSKYATESGKYDSARGAAAGLPRGPKGSEQNFARSKAVGQALRKAKVGQ